MLQHTLDRSDQIVPPERRVTIIARDHQQEALLQFLFRLRGKVILQPANRETATGVFLGLTWIRAHDPEATVLIFPSDHFVYPEERFVEATYRLARAARKLKHWVFLLGAPPDQPDAEYGWIQPGAHLGWIDGHRVQGAKAFIEKPSPELCKLAMSSGALWNTMVIAAKVETLWRLGQCCLPAMMRLFDVYAESIGSAQENAILDGIYQAMPSCNLSSQLLQEFPQYLAVMELQDVLWSDWGKPERIVETLRRLGREPRFSLAHIA